MTAASPTPAWTTKVQCSQGSASRAQLRLDLVGFVASAQAEAQISLHVARPPAVGSSPTEGQEAAGKALSPNTASDCFLGSAGH